MKRLYGVGLAVAAMVLLDGCATKEWSITNAVCEQEARAAYAPDMRTRSVQKSREVEVPDGTLRCKSAGEGDAKEMICVPGMKNETQYYTDIENYDLNAPARNSYRQNCTTNACLTKYGNSDCETGS